ncbi:hypothetical protein PPYR_11837 [Photinus pyralis]|uniref:Uncharacterized protein n=1 Tax=Photinus pyralis TaxID=7054 RepID=A0A1Y1K925_PHOPY|nr:uncharacterized protein LOC116176610 [Photinus pyralis]KAB0794998.1 hypothetical protein PPYR_11837 [Photinus pyralis]
MRTKNFLIFLCSIVTVSLLLIIFGQQKPSSIQDIVTSTHQQLRNFKDTLRDAETKTLVADEKYLQMLGFVDKPRLYPTDVWHNTSLPVIVTYVLEGQESQAIGFANNIGKVLPNNTILIYNIGLGSYGLRMLQNYCNSSRCQVISFNLNEFPSHVEDEALRAYRPVVIQDALQHTGSIFFLECNIRFKRFVIPEVLLNLYNSVVKGSGILTWAMPLKNAVSSRTHKKMFDYFRTDADNFLFVQMVSADIIILVNTESTHKDVMLPWVQCALTQDCIYPIGAQSGGCRFNKKPQYRYSGCHNYDASALNIVLGLKFKLDSSKYTYQPTSELFKIVPLDRAIIELQGLEQNATTEGKQYESSFS